MCSLRRLLLSSLIAMAHPPLFVSPAGFAVSSFTSPKWIHHVDKLRMIKQSSKRLSAKAIFVL